MADEAGIPSMEKVEWMGERGQTGLSSCLAHDPAARGEKRKSIG